MHERSLVQALLRQVQAIADGRRPSAVRAVRVRIGEFSGVDAELLALAYAELAADTPLRDAELIVERTTLQAECRSCGNEFHVQEFAFVCPSCASRDLAIVGGEELLLDSITLEEPSYA